MRNYSILTEKGMEGIKNDLGFWILKIICEGWW